MREILFRGKKKNGKWTYGDLLHGNGYIVIGNNDISRDTVGQFTGLTDKNGKKIFEGDIVRLTEDFDDYSIPDRSVLGVVHIGEYPNDDTTVYGCYIKWQQERFLYRCDLWYWINDNPDPFEVIGNIYDNPEMPEPEVEENEK